MAWTVFPQIDVEKLDAYLLTALATNFADYSIKGDSTKNISIIFSMDASEQIDILELFKKNGGTLIELSSYDEICYHSAEVSLNLLKILASQKSIHRLQLSAALKPNRLEVRKMVATGSISNRTLPDLPVSSFDTLLGVIDHGCPFAHACVSNNTGTRVLSIWDQDESPDFSHVDGAAPKGFGYGRQIKRDILNYYIKLSTDSLGNFDEDKCYRIAQYPAMQSRITHGAHTLGLLVGNKNSPSLSVHDPLLGGHLDLSMTDVSTIVDTVFVQLPRSALLAPSATQTSKSILDGLRYIVDCASENTKNITVVVCYGDTMGPHDGSSLIEQALDTIVNETKVNGKNLNIVFPSGNTFDRATHALISCIAVDKPERVSWWVPPDNDVACFVEFWVKHDGRPVKLNICPPGSFDSLSIQVSDKNKTLTQLWPNSITPTAAITVLTHSDQTQVLVRVAPTGSNNMPRIPGLAGRWSIQFEVSAARVSPIDAYVGWGGKNFGFPKRVHATKLFAETQGVEIDGSGSILGTGCGQKTFMAGAYEKWQPYQRASYSGAGGSRGGKRQVTGADVLAIAEESPNLHGIHCIGTRSTVFVRVNGTSVAAPQVARYLANGGDLTKQPSPVNRPASSSQGAMMRLEFGEPRLNDLLIQPNSQ